MTLADDLAALIVAREAAPGWKPNVSYISTNPRRAYNFALGAFIEAHGAELAALVAENARLRAALVEILEYETDQYVLPIVRAALRGPS